MCVYEYTYMDDICSVIIGAARVVMTMYLSCLSLCLMLDAGMCRLSALLQSISSIPALYSNSSAAAKTILTKHSKSPFVAYPSRFLLSLSLSLFLSASLSLLAPTVRCLLRAIV